MIPTPDETRGTILTIRDEGSIFQMMYHIDGDGIDAINWDHRMFANFYEGATGRSFARDYGFGAGREYVSRQLVGKRIVVRGEPFSQTVSVED